MERPDYFFVSTVDQRVLRLSHGDSGWWANGELTIIDGLHLSCGDAAATGDVSVVLIPRCTGDTLNLDVWNLQRGERIESLRIGSTQISITMAASDETVAVLEEESGRVRVIDRQGQVVRTQRVARDSGTFTISGDGQTMAVWSFGRSPEIVIYRAAGGSTRFPALQHPEGSDAFGLGLSHDGARIGMSVYGAIRVIETTNGRSQLDRAFEGAYLASIAIGPEGKLFVQGTELGGGMLIEGSIDLNLPFVLHSADVHQVVWTDAGIMIAGRGTLAAWDNEGNPSFALERSLPYSAAAWRALEPPLVEVLGMHRHVYDASTGRNVSGDVLSSFEQHQAWRVMNGVVVTDAHFEAAAAEDAYLMDVSVDGSRRILMPSGARARLVRSDSMETIVEVGDVADRHFSSDGTWFATTSSANENWARDLVIRRSSDGEVLASVALSSGSSVSHRIQRMTVLPNDLILTQNHLGVRALRFVDGNLNELGRHDSADVESWATQESEMLIAVVEDEQTRVQRLSLPSLERIGVQVVEGSRDPVLGYLPDGRNFGILVNRHLEFAELPAD